MFTDGTFSWGTLHFDAVFAKKTQSGESKVFLVKQIPVTCLINKHSKVIGPTTQQNEQVGLTFTLSLSC